MFKRFVIGFALGVGLMYWYIHYGEQTIAAAERWVNRSASEYRGDRTRRAVEEATGKGNR